MNRLTQAILLLPVSALMICLVAAPGLLLVGYSFFDWVYVERGDEVTVANYIVFFSSSATWRVLTITLRIAVPVTFLSISGGYVVAYYVVFGRSNGRRLLFALTLTALMASYLVRIYAWRILLGQNGVVNGALLGLGIIDQPLSFILFSPTAVIIAETSFLIPMAALIFVAALSGIPPELHEAARDLGASSTTTFRRVTLPLTGRAVLSTTALVFFISCGDYLTPLYVGGPGSVTIGRLIADYFGANADYGLGAAYSVMLFLGFAVVFVALRALMTISHLLPGRVI